MFLVDWVVSVDPPSRTQLLALCRWLIGLFLSILQVGAVCWLCVVGEGLFLSILLMKPFVGSALSV